MRALPRQVLLAVLAIGSTLSASHVGAQGGPAAFPARPLRIVVPFAAGGPTDITARNIAPRMTELLGQSIVVDNRPGATGIIGADLVAKSPPDGYTLLLGTASVIAINMVTYAKLPYDTLRDLQPLTPVMTTGTILVVYPSMPARNLKELVALARAKPSQIAMGSAGNGGTLHLALEMLMKQAEVRMTHVPYKGAAPAVVDVIAGQINGMFVDLPVVSPYIKAGKVRALAVASPNRSTYFPDVPTTKEAGFPNVELQNYYALLLPARTPRSIVDKLHDAVVKTVNTPSVREKLIAVGADPLTMTADEFSRFIRADIDMWDKVVKAAGVKIEQ
ncbi:MAG TPA: tripartite tricarboxylate transporter substrate binding protein [Burkholderiales bacterium]|nr:tripartite tricarboxylate transporter substrate binding protein [Burkholderiales bacterium]